MLNNIQAQIDSVRHKVNNVDPVRTLVGIAHYVNSDQIDTVYIAGQHDFYNELLELAGGVNVYTDTAVKVPSVSAEGIIRMNPDAIIDIFPCWWDWVCGVRKNVHQVAFFAIQYREKCVARSE